MVEIINNRRSENVVFNILGMHKVWTLKSKLEIPRSSIKSVIKKPNQLSGWWKGWRIPGTHIPYFIVAGSYFKNHKRTFWDVTSQDRTINIELDGFDYDNLMIDVENPDQTIKDLNNSNY
jgi:hypothetical protein